MAHNPVVPELLECSSGKKSEGCEADDGHGKAGGILD